MLYVILYSYNILIDCFFLYSIVYMCAVKFGVVLLVWQDCFLLFAVKLFVDRRCFCVVVLYRH